MGVPVLVLTPTPESLPLGWSVLPVEAVEPTWWSDEEPRPLLWRPGPPGAPADPIRRPGPRGCFAAPEPVATTLSLGQQVVASEVYKSQQLFVRRAPDKAAVAAVVDALAAEGRLSAVAAAATAGAPAVIRTASWPRCSDSSMSMATRS